MAETAVGRSFQRRLFPVELLSEFRFAENIELVATTNALRSFEGVFIPGVLFREFQRVTSANKAG